MSPRAHTQKAATTKSLNGLINDVIPMWIFAIEMEFKKKSKKNLDYYSTDWLTESVDWLAITSLRYFVFNAKSESNTHNFESGAKISDNKNFYMHVLFLTFGFHTNFFFFSLTVASTSFNLNCLWYARLSQFTMIYIYYRFFVSSIMCMCEFPLSSVT